MLITEDELDIDKFEIASIKLGFKNYNELTTFKMYCQEGMIKFGGSFYRKLGYMLGIADAVNTIKIISMWKKECDEYEKLYKKFREKEIKSL